MSTAHGVAATARTALASGYRVTLVRDATTTVSAAEQDRILGRFARTGAAVRTTEGVLAGPVTGGAGWAPSTLVAMVPVAVGAVCVVVQIVRTARVEGADKWTRRSAYRAFMRNQYTANLVMVATLALPTTMR